MKNLFYLLPIATLLLTSCNDDDVKPEPVNEEELITTVVVEFENQANPSNLVTLTFKDLDGDGPNAPQVTQTGTFQPNQAYDVLTEFLNESVNPAEDITEEIIDEASDHQVFYQGSLGSLTNYSDEDPQGKPIGLLAVYTTGAVGTNKNFTVTLRHLPNKNAQGVATGSITNAGGETDIEATFTGLSVN
jgi:hypothetical protein